MYENSYNSRVIYSRKLYLMLLIQMIIIGKIKLSNLQDWSLHWCSPRTSFLSSSEKTRRCSGSAWSWVFLLQHWFCCSDLLVGNLQSTWWSIYYSRFLQLWCVPSWLQLPIPLLDSSSSQALQVKQQIIIFRHHHLLVFILSYSQKEINLLRIYVIFKRKPFSRLWNVYDFFDHFPILVNFGVIGFIFVRLLPHLWYINHCQVLNI
jgi:hypothetical protein